MSCVPFVTFILLCDSMLKNLFDIDNMLKYRGHETYIDQSERKRKISRWWLASMGFPVIVGTLCAMAIMFNICATAQGWKQALDSDNHIIKTPLPQWKVALKALSLALASTAYILYLLTMAFHYNPQKGFAIPVLGWLASGVILFSLIGVEAHQHRKAITEQSTEYTQNFYAGILAAGLYCLIAILLAAYMACTNSLQLSPTDRRMVECSSIILRVIIFTILLLGGAAMYSTVEGWSLMDSLYFTDYTVLTIGIGNITPQTHLGRSLLFPYATAGIINLGFVISGVASFTKQTRHLKLKYQIDEAQRIFRGQKDTEKMANGEESQSTFPIPSKFPKRDEVLKLHQIKSSFYRKSRWRELIFFSVAWFILWLISAEIFHRSEKSEGWTYFTGLYFTYTSLTTIGYGDYYPTSNFGKVFFVFWSLLALPILTNLVTTMGNVLHRLLLVCSGYVWRNLLHKGPTPHHHSHEYRSQLFEEPGRSVPGSSTSHATEPGHGTTIEDHSRDLSSVGLTPKIVQASGTGVRATTQYRLRLAEGMTTLLSFLRDESVENWEDLCCTWSRVIPLLHAGDSDSSGSHEIASFSVSAKTEHVTMMKLMDPEQALAERNAEISWMMTLLVEKLCSDMRKELFEAK